MAGEIQACEIVYELRFNFMFYTLIQQDITCGPIFRLRFASSMALRYLDYNVLYALVIYL